MGKIIAGLIGWFSFGFIGIIVGLIVGHIFDKGRLGLRASVSPERRAQMERTFFETVFPLLGHIAKADGRVSTDEISGTEALMSRMGLTEQTRQLAIQLFKKGIEPDFSVDETIRAFVHCCGNTNELKQILLVYLITLAFADGHLHDAEEKILSRVASDLGYSRFAFNHLLGMVKAQSYFYRENAAGSGYEGMGAGGAQPTKSELETAYAALGVKNTGTDAEIKRAYRKLMSEYHPDKLSGRGVPDDVVKVATERAQEIQTAYELIKKFRKTQAELA